MSKISCIVNKKTKIKESNWYTPKKQPPWTSGQYK
jgi:hypothetical protein